MLVGHPGETEEEFEELRGFVEREWELKLAEATRDVIDVEQRISSWGRRRNATSAVRTEPGSIDMALLRSREEYINRIDLAVERLHGELATLEVLGVAPPQMWGLTLLETGLMGAVAGLLSLPLGWLLAAILVGVINVRSFGWTMRLEGDPWLFAQALSVSVVAAMLASVYPLLRLRRRPLSAALRAE